MPFTDMGGQRHWNCLEKIVVWVKITTIQQWLFGSTQNMKLGLLDEILWLTDTFTPTSLRNYNIKVWRSSHNVCSHGDWRLFHLVNKRWDIRSLHPTKDALLGQRLIYLVTYIVYEWWRCQENKKKTISCSSSISNWICRLLRKMLPSITALASD